MLQFTQNEVTDQDLVQFLENFEHGLMREERKLIFLTLFSLNYIFLNKIYYQQVKFNTHYSPPINWLYMRLFCIPKFGIPLFS